MTKRIETKLFLLRPMVVGVTPSHDALVIDFIIVNIFDHHHHRCHHHPHRHHRHHHHITGKDYICTNSQDVPFLSLAILR